MQAKSFGETKGGSAGARSYMRAPVIISNGSLTMGNKYQ